MLIMATDSLQSRVRIDGITRVGVAELVALRTHALKAGMQPVRLVAANAGGHASESRGRGMDYAESRAYQPGDDVRNIDWRRTARSGKLHTKVFQAERERGVLVVIDTHATMRFGTRVRYKSVAAARAAAWIAWTAVRGGDRVGALAFGDVRDAVDPQAGARGALAVVGALARWDAQAAVIAADGSEALPAALQRAGRLAPRGGRLWLFTDGWCVDEAASHALARAAQHAEVTVVATVDPLECELPPTGAYVFEASSGPRRVDLVAAGARAKFRAGLGRGECLLTDACRQAGVTRVTLTTRDEPDRALASAWRRRAVRP